MAADNGAKVPIPFDVRTIKDLVALMSRHDVSEIDLREGDLRIRLRRGPLGAPRAGRESVSSSSPPATATPPPIPAVVTAAATGPKLLEIKAMTPGTFYVAPSPDAKPYVQVGDRVTPSTVVGTIEAMKIYNEVPAECNGVIREICVKNQQPVEYEQVLFKVDPTG